MSLRRSLIACALACALSTVAFRAAATEVRVVAPPAIDSAELTTQVSAALDPLKRDGSVTVTIDEASRSIRVTFTPKEGAPVERSVTTPDDPKEMERAVVWLAVNVTSDEASDLIASLRPPPPPPPPPAPVEPPPNPPAAPVGTPPCMPDAPRSRVAFSLFSPVGVPAQPTRTSFAFGFFYGDAVAVHGASLSTVQRFRCNAEGAALAVAGNVVHEDAEGFVASGGLNIVGGRTRGASLAGGAVVHGDVEGVIGAPLTLTRRDLAGAQLGVANITRGRMTGAQLGTANYAGDVTGAQLGVLNIGGKVSGTQIGVINVAEDVDAAVGVVSVSWSRRVRLVAWASTVTPVEVGILLEGKRVYSAVNFGRLIQDLLSNGKFLIGLEVGVHVIRSDDEGVMWDVLAGTDTGVGVGSSPPVDVLRLGTRLGYRFAPRFAGYLYGGTAFTGVSDNANQTPTNFKARAELGGGTIF